MFKKTLISIVLSTQIGFCAPPIAGANNIVFDPTNLATAMEQLTALNKQIESSIQMLDQFNKVNKVLEQSEQLLFNSYEKLYNPKRQIENIINNAKNTFRKAQRLKIQNLKMFYSKMILIPLGEALFSTTKTIQNGRQFKKK